jgi:hypothetical protein
VEERKERPGYKLELPLRFRILHSLTLVSLPPKNLACSVCYLFIFLMYTSPSRVPAVLLRPNSADVYFSYNIYCPKAFHRPDRPIRNVEYRRKNLLFLKPYLSGLKSRTFYGFVTFVSVF